MVLKPGHCGKKIRNTWKVLRCVHEDGSVLHNAKEERDIKHSKIGEGYLHMLYLV
jgi:hypothetical protein